MYLALRPPARTSTTDPERALSEAARGEARIPEQQAPVLRQPPPDDPSDWQQRMARADEAWRQRTLAAIARFSEEHALTPAVRSELSVIVTRMLDEIASARDELSAGAPRGPARTRISEARDEAFAALEALLGEDLSAALNEEIARASME